MSSSLRALKRAYETSPSFLLNLGLHRPSNKFLRRFDGLNRSSPDFPDEFANLLGEVEWGFAWGLQPKDKEWFIEYLDNVLSTLDLVNRVHRKCLGHLQWACHFANKFPRSQILNVSSLVPIPNPTPIGPYEACYEGLLNGSKVCVKKLEPSLAQEWNQISTWNFCRVVMWKYLAHPNTVPFLGFTNKPGQFVSTLVPGNSVTAYITSSPDTVDPLSLLIGIASGLEYLHSCDVAHGDLGGPNIIVDDSGHPRIINFGLAKVFSAGVFGKVRACERWGSPETLREDGLGSWYSIHDIFSFAMVIVEVFTGQIPFFPETDSMAQSAILEGKRPARPTHPDLTDRLWALVERCWNEEGDSQPEVSEVARILDDCRSESMGKDRQITQLSIISKATAQNSTSIGNGPPSVNDTPEGSSSDSIIGDGNTRILLSSPPLVPVDWFSQVTSEILDLTDQVASVALFGPIGVGKSFMAHATLDHDQTRAAFGDNCHFIRCDDIENSPDGFIKRLSEAIHVDLAQLRSRLESSPPILLVLDGVDAFLDPPIPGAEEIHGMIEEFGSYEHVCLVTTSRMYPDMPGFHRISIPAPPEDGARDMFHSLCDLGRSSVVDALIARLDFHPLAIKLLASAIRENNWDEGMLLKVCDDQTSVLREHYHQKLKDVVEPMFDSPTLKNLGDAARDVLGAIAAFPSGIGEHQLRSIFRATGGVGEVVDVLCRFSLVSRRDGIVRMLSLFQFYFLESMLVVGEAGEDIKWGPDCMPKRLWQPVYPPLYPTRDSFPCATSDTTPRQNPDDASPRQGSDYPSPHQDTNHVPPRPEIGPPCATPRLDVSTRKRWIRRLPKIIKQRLLALFGRRIEPAILIELRADPEGVPPTSPQVDPTNAPLATPQDSLGDFPSAARQDPTLVRPTGTQKDLPDLPPASPQDDPTDAPHPERDDDATNPALTTPQQQCRVIPEAYEV